VGVTLGVTVGVLVAVGVTLGVVVAATAWKTKSNSAGPDAPTVTDSVIGANPSGASVTCHTRVVPPVPSGTFNRVYRPLKSVVVEPPNSLPTKALPSGVEVSPLVTVPWMVPVSGVGVPKSTTML